MSDEQQPRAEWVFPEEEKKGNKGRVWLIVGLSVAAVAIVAVLLFLFLPREDGAPEATASPTPIASETPSQSSSPSPSDSATAEPEPDQTPITTPPPAPDPDLATFTGQVQPWLDDASTGLSMVAEMSGQEATQVVDSLQGDAGRLSGVVAPSSISSAWYAAVGEYASRLGELQSAIDGGGDMQGGLGSATAALQEVRGLVGL